MKRVNVTEFRKNLFYYLELCSKEKIQITNHGIVVAVLSNPNDDYNQTLASLCGCLKEYDTGEDYKDIVGEGIMDKNGFSN